MKMIILLSLIAVMLSFAAKAGAATLSPAVIEIQQRTISFASAGYTEVADDMARQTTRQLLAPSRDKIATAAEADVMVDAHLKTELYYAFNTKWGTGNARDHRIVYDFLSQLDKSSSWTRQQREHLTILTVLSLAAQEYFWNEKSTIDDLQNRVRRELRYGAFKEAGHALNISNAVCLDEAYFEGIIGGWVNTALDAKLKFLMAGFKGKTLGTTYEQIVIELDARFGGRKESLPFGNFEPDVLATYCLDRQMDLNPMPSLGDGMCGEHSLFIPTDGACGRIQDGNGRYKILRAILDNSNDHVARRLYLLNSEHMDGVKFTETIEASIAELRVSDAKKAAELEKKLNAYQEQKEKLEIYKGTQRTAEKEELLRKVMGLSGLRDILDVFNKAVSRPENVDRLAEDKAFREIIDEIIRIGTNTETGGHTEIKKRWEMIKVQVSLLDQQIALKKEEIENAGKVAKFNARQVWSAVAGEIKAFKKQRDELGALVKVDDEKTEALPASTIESNQLDEKIKEKEFEEKAKWADYQSIKLDYAETDKMVSGKYKLIVETLKDLIGPDMLLSNLEAFSMHNLSQYGYSNFINDICQAICAFVGANTTGECIADLWNEFNYSKDLIEKQIDKQLVLERLAMVESLSVLPREFTSDTLAKEMEAQAKKPGELDGWLPCDSVYTQLWGILNNFNVFVFSGGEEYGKTPLNIIACNKDVHDQLSIPYDEGITGKHLATVILTSPTAKNVFLDKSPNHYNKFISPGDYAAMAKAQRHLEWSKLSTRYDRYPEPIKS